MEKDFSGWQGIADRLSDKMGFVGFTYYAYVMYYGFLYILESQGAFES